MIRIYLQVLDGAGLLAAQGVADTGRLITTFQNAQATLSERPTAESRTSR
jgi:hypothetical protein